MNAVIVTDEEAPAAEGGSALHIQAAANEGATLQISLPSVNTNALRISNINLAGGFLASEDAIGQIDNALDVLLNQRADLGAIVVRLGDAAQNDAVAATNLQASESSIRDTNIGKVTTDYTRQQILVEVGTSVLAQSNTNNASLLALFR